MPRKGKRKTVARGIYLDSGGFSVRVVVGGHRYETRMPLDSTLAELQRARAGLVATGHTQTPREARHTLRADAVVYLRMVQHLASRRDLAGHLNAWIAALGDTPRHRITPRAVLEIRHRWLKAGKAAKTCNHRLDTLRNLYRRLDVPRPTISLDSLLREGE